MPQSIKSTDTLDGFDGHINRNIRLAMTLIDMTKPYIFVERILRIKIEGLDALQIDFKLNGCAVINYIVNDQQNFFVIDGYCNQLVPRDKV